MPVINNGTVNVEKSIAFCISDAISPVSTFLAAEMLLKDRIIARIVATQDSRETSIKVLPIDFMT